MCLEVCGRRLDQTVPGLTAASQIARCKLVACHMGLGTSPRNLPSERTKVGSLSARVDRVRACYVGSVGIEQTAMPRD